MTDKIVLDNQYSNYSVDLEYEFGLLKSKRDGRNRKFTTIALQDPSAARHFGFQPGQTNPEWQWTVYNNGEDKSNGSLVDSNISDYRFSVGKKDSLENTGEIAGVDITNEVFSVHGNVTELVTSGDSIRVAGSTGNNGTYSVSSVSYDAVNNETDITVNEDVTDSTADGYVQRGIQTIFQQNTWLQQYMADNTSDPRWKLFGGRFSDYEGNNSINGTNVVIQEPQINQASNRPTTYQGTIRMKLGVTV